MPPARQTAASPAAPSPAVPAQDLQPVGTPASTPGTGSALIPHDLSPYGMFMHADVVVKAVMVGLAFASLATWTILLAKTLELVAARTGARRSLVIVAEAATLEAAAANLEGRKAPVVRLVDAALAERERSRGLAPAGVQHPPPALL